jgi:hypothetical protein
VGRGREKHEHEEDHELEYIHKVGIAKNALTGSSSVTSTPSHSRCSPRYIGIGVVGGHTVSSVHTPNSNPFLDLLP